jgi:replication factor A1
MDTITFTAVAEDLVDKTASEASQNMKIDASDHAVALDQAIGKTRLFTIGMNPEYFSKFSINYVFKKSYPVDGQNLNTISSAPQVKPLSLFYIDTSYCHFF